MPPISCSRSAPLTPAPRRPRAAPRSRRADPAWVDGFFGDVVRGAWRIGHRRGHGHSSIRGSVGNCTRHRSLVCPPCDGVLARRRNPGPRNGSASRAVTPLYAPPVQHLLQPLRRHRELRHRARHADGVVDRRGDRRADAGHAALACPLDAERIERARVVLAQHDLHLGRLAHGRQQIVGEGRRQRIAALVVGEFLEQRPAQALGEAADDLPLHQRRD